MAFLAVDSSARLQVTSDCAFDLFHRWKIYSRVNADSDIGQKQELGRTM